MAANMLQQQRTNLGQSSAHPNIVVWFDELLGIRPDWVLKFFEDQVRRGSQFRAGQTVQIGWMLIKLEKTTNGELEVWEPDVGVMPVRWTRGITTTLRHLTIQNAVCDEIGAAREYPSMRDAGTVTLGFGPGIDQFEMTRREPVQGHSGWIFSGSGEKKSNVLHSLFEIGIWRPACIPFLALPPAVSVSISSSEVKVLYGGVSISSEKSKLLSDLADSKLFH
jgi:hypothetical protein